MKLLFFWNILLWICVGCAGTALAQSNAPTREPDTVSARRLRGRARPTPTPSASNAKIDAALDQEGPKGPLIGKITVTGQRKIEPDAIIAKLKSKEGAVYSDADIREDLSNLNKTGYFFDVDVSKELHDEKMDLFYHVVEKPSIAEISFVGQSELKTEELQESLGVKQYEILNLNKIHDGIEKIVKTYEDKGYFLAKVDYQVTDVVKDETVKVVLTIKEGDKVKVKKVTFLGNRKIKDGFIKAHLKTSESGFFSFLSGSGGYKQEDFDHDMQGLRYLYFNEGYVQVKIDRPQVYVTPDKKSIYITIRIDEGEQYNVGDIDFAGDLLYSREELFEAIKIKEHKVFSYEVLQNDLSELQAKYGDLGYAFANIIPRTRINDKERKVDITFEIDKGNKVYFGRINVVGNSKTRDKVVRRELRVREGELYNETRKRTSLENVKRLGFFEDVNFKTSTPPEKPDQLNVDIVVKERNTGSIQLGAGYGSYSGFTLQGQVNQSNFLGKGESLSAGINANRYGNFFNFNFTEPYFMDTRWSLGFDIYQSVSNRLDYSEKKLGAAFRLGHPFGEHWVGSFRYKLENVSFEPLYDQNGNLVTDESLFPLNSVNGLASTVTGIIEYDTRNDRFSPSKGMFSSASYEYAGAGGRLHYYKGSFTYRYFHKLFWEVVWRNNYNMGVVGSTDSNEEVPFNEKFLLGGPYSLRGYRYFTAGKSTLSKYLYNLYYYGNSSQTTGPGNPSAPNGGAPNPSYGYTNDQAIQNATHPVGGTKQLLYQTELEFPLIAEAGIKGVTFYDMGIADDALSAGNIYSDIGFGFRWFSPIGPLRFEWGFPLRSTPTSPDPVVFDFSIGAPF